MTYQVVIQPPAEENIINACNWIAKDSPTNADNWFRQLRERILSLEEFPQRCGLAPENDAFADEIRQLIHRPYRVLFTIRNETVHILHVRHGSMLPIDPNAKTLVDGDECPLLRAGITTSLEQLCFSQGARGTHPNYVCFRVPLLKTADSDEGRYQIALNNYAPPSRRRLHSW